MAAVRALPDRADVVIVGGGTAGCVLAARLSEDPATRVLLIEEGPDPRPIPDVIADPDRQPELIRHTDYVRRYGVRRPGGSAFPLLSGRVMGGGSSVNNLAVVRPMRVDLDDWARLGGEAWGYEALLPLLRALEDDPDFAGSPIHGTGGPIRMFRHYRLDDPADPPVQALLTAARELGIPRCDDLNVAAPSGVCASPYNIVDGRRQSTVVAFLDPVRDRPNLSIAAESSVVRVLLDGRRACGVEMQDRHGQYRTVRSERVVLAAGVFHSPQVLMRSGIGPRDELERHGIPVAVPLEGVGRGFQDHAVVNVAFQGTERLLERHVIPKVRLIVSSDTTRSIPDLHVFMLPSIPMPGSPPLLPVSIRLLEHRSMGRVRLAPDDPGALPTVEPALLEHPDDVAAMVDGLRFVETLVAHRALAAFYGPRVTPPPDTDPVAHIRSTYTSYHHGVGTCRFGPDGDPQAVVDPTLRVHGVTGLWVADASVIPIIPRSNTNLAAILVGEIGARHVAAG